MDNTTGGGFNRYSSTPRGSQATPATGARSTRGPSNLRPVTIKQLLEATQAHPDAEFKVDDVDLGHITFVAQITNISEQATYSNLGMNDGTGGMEVKTYFTENPEKGGRKLAVGDYARILGSLRSFGGKRSVNAHQVHPVKDYNEVHYHLLEATAVHLHLTRGPPEQLAQAADGRAGAGNPQGLDTMMTGTGHDGEGTGYGGQGAGYGDGAYGGGGHSFASKNAKRVLDALQCKPGQEDGLHVNTIAQLSGLTIQDVQKAVDELIDAGSAYTTVDDSHIALIG